MRVFRDGAAVRLGLLALVLALQAPGAAAQGCGVPALLANDWEVAADVAAQGFDGQRLCAAVQAFQDSPFNLHGLVVERRGRLVAESYRNGKDASTYTVVPTTREFGPAALHDARSITKSVVSLLWGIAQDEGRMPPPETPVLGLFPALADLQLGGRERITIEHLLRMRSGLAWREGNVPWWDNDELGLLWRGDTVRHVFDRPMAEDPGSRFVYNGGNTAVLGQLLAERTGMPMPDYARRKLFDPLGIQQWEWVGDVWSRPRAYSGLRLRPRDLAKIGRMVLDGGVWNGQQVVPAAWLRASFTPANGTSGYGYQWWMGTVRSGGRTFGWQAGMGNGGQRLFMLPQLDLVVVVNAGEYGNEMVGRELLRLLSLVVAALDEAPQQ